MSEIESTSSAPAGERDASCESPPAAPNPAREPMEDPRTRLLQLAVELMRSRNRRLVIEYLRLRRAV
jgi:hypothetical protein